MIESVLWIVFVLACIVVSGVILLQEGKGGGLGEAFGGAGQQTFGVKAEGINKFTGWVTAAVIVIAVAITKVREDSTAIQFGGAPPAPVGDMGAFDPGAATGTEPAPPDGAGNAAPPAGDGAGNGAAGDAGDAGGNDAGGEAPPAAPPADDPPPPGGGGQ
jgi:preprotein translocase subunit SecG